MSELKAFNMPRYAGVFTMHEVYLKSEADKYIALLKDKANYNEYAYKHKSEELADTCRFYEEELRRHKYKRCLAMAWWCESEEKRLEAISPIFDTDRECWEYNSNYWVRWCKRWLELAEKFKPNSTAQQGKG